MKKHMRKQLEKKSPTEPPNYVLVGGKMGGGDPRTKPFSCESVIIAMRVNIAILNAGIMKMHMWKHTVERSPKYQLGKQAKH